MHAMGRSSAFRAVVAAATTLAPLLKAHAAEPRAVDYLTPQSVAAASVRLADLAATPSLQAYPIEVVAAATDDFLGLPLGSIQRVTAVIEPPMGMMPQYAVVLNATESLDFDRFRGELIRHTQRGELLGRPFLESQLDLAPSFCLLDDNTLAVGPKLFLKRLIRGVDGSDGDLAAAMAGDDGTHLRAAVLLQPLMPLIQLGLMGAKQEVEPEFHRFLDGVELLDRIEIAGDLSGERESSLIVYANDTGAADQVQSLVAEGLALVNERADANGQISQLRDHPEAVVRAWAVYLDRMTEQQAASAAALREGEEAFVLGRLRPGDSQSPMMTVAIAGVLVALLLPAVQAAREAARRNASMNNLKQLALAMHNHHDARNRFPAHAIYSESGEPLLSWRVALLPYLGEDALYERFNLEEPWNSTHNLPLLNEMPELFFDPSSPAPDLDPSSGKTHYLGVVGTDAAFSGDADGRPFRRFIDGTAKTMLIVQVDDRHAVEWTKPAEFDFAKHRENPFAGIGAIHPGVFLAAFADGHVQAIATDIDPDLLRKTMTVNGREPIGDLP